MKRLLILLFILILIATAYAQNETIVCSKVYDFIINNYNPTENKLEFTDEDFDLLQMQTTVIPGDLKNHITYYNDLCDYELPFIDYNGEWPKEKIVEKETQSFSVGFNKFLEQLKKDFIYIILFIFGIIVLVFLIDKLS